MINTNILGRKSEQGDEEAFRQLYNEYSDLLYGYGMKIAVMMIW